MVKQVIVVRKDLNMPKGKIAAQTAHASSATLLKNIKHYSGNDFLIELNNDAQEWLNGVYTKIVLGCNCEDDINELAEKAEDLNIPFAIITDSGKTIFNGKQTVTCIGIGPANSDLINQITGNLNLL